MSHRQLDPMEPSPPMERFCRFLPWTPWPSCKYSAACSCCAFTKPNALQNRSCIVYCPGCIRDFQSMPDRRSMPPKSPLCNPRPAISPALQKLDDGNLVMDTPPDPRTGATSITLDPLEWIHRLTSHIPDPGRHCQRFYGAYANRARISVPPADGQSAASPPANHPQQDDSDFSRETRSTWARLIKKIFEADPLLCSCGARMRIVSFITDPRVVDRILRHLESGRCRAQDPFVPRAPPPAPATIRQ